MIDYTEMFRNGYKKIILSLEYFEVPMKSIMFKITNNCGTLYNR